MHAWTFHGPFDATKAYFFSSFLYYPLKGRRRRILRSIHSLYSRDSSNGSARSLTRRDARMWRMHTCALVCGFVTRDTPPRFTYCRARQKPPLAAISRRHLFFPRKVTTRLLYRRDPPPPSSICRWQSSLGSITFTRPVCVCDFVRDVLLQPGGKRVPIKDIHRHRHLANENISHLGYLSPTMLSRRVSQI